MHEEHTFHYHGSSADDGAAWSLRQKFLTNPAADPAGYCMRVVARTRVLVQRQGHHSWKLGRGNEDSATRITNRGHNELRRRGRPPIVRGCLHIIPWMNEGTV